MVKEENNNNMNIDNIINKFGYSEEFGVFLKEIYPELVNEFSNEQMVYEALLNTPIVSVNNIYEYLNDNRLLDNANGLVSDGDLRRSSGVFHSKPNIIYKKDTNSYEISSVDRVVAVVNFNFSNTSKGTLIHELCHLIKGYNNEYIINNDILISRNGLMEQHYKLSYNDGNIEKSLIKEVGVGLEEGLTSVSEEEISKKVVSKDYKSSGYGVVNVIARNLLSLDGIKEKVVSAEIYHDKSELYNLFEEDYIKLEEISDRIYKLNLVMFSQAFDLDKMEKTKEELINILNTEYKEVYEKMNNNLKL